MTKCADTRWKLLKAKAMKPDYKETPDYIDLDDTNKDVINHLIIAQNNIGIDNKLDGSVLY